MKILITIFIFIILLLLLSIHKEHFVNDFDDVLDDKCTNFNPKLNNYFGPWEGGNGTCAEYRCPNETCSYIIEDSKINYPNIIGHTYIQDTSEQIIINSPTNEKTCTSKDGQDVDGVYNVKSRYYCNSNLKKNSSQHNEFDFCYELLEEGNNTFRWSKNIFINTMNENGNYEWKNINTGAIKPESCIKDMLDCSQCNYYCCEHYRGDDKMCRKDTATDVDTYIHFNLTRDMTCEPGNTCSIEDCLYNNSNYFKDCWIYEDSYEDSKSRKWINKRFEREMNELTDECDFFFTDERGNKIKYTDVSSMCKETPPIVNQFECSSMSNHNCYYIDENNSVFFITYQGVLNHKGDACLYKSINDQDIKYIQHPNQSKVITESRLDKESICPELTPNDCIGEDYFLKKINGDIPYECSLCPFGTFRNNKQNAFSINDACTPIISCPSINQCSYLDFEHLDEIPENLHQCHSCWSNIDTGNEILKKIYLELSPNKSNCDIVEDKCYYNTIIKPDNTTSNIKFECPPGKEFYFLNNKICDNCDNGTELKVNGDYLVCSNVVHCNSMYSHKCLNSDGLTFDNYVYDNESDKFSPCRFWKQGENTIFNKQANKSCVDTGKCINSCPKFCGTKSIGDGEIHLVRGSGDTENECILEII